MKNYTYYKKIDLATFKLYAPDGQTKRVGATEALLRNRGLRPLPKVANGVKEDRRRAS